MQNTTIWLQDKTDSNWIDTRKIIWLTVGRNWQVCFYVFELHAFDLKQRLKIDKIYAKLSDITFNEKMLFDFDVNHIKPTLSKESMILDAGTGTGKYYKYFFK